MRCVGERVTVVPDDYTTRVKVIIKCLALPQELRGEDDLRDHHLEAAVGKALPVAELLPHAFREPDRYSGFHDHHGIRIDFQNQFDYLLYMGSVEEVLLGIVVGRCRNDHKLSVPVSRTTVEGRL